MFQPHEAHVPYILRFFIDFNLCGMGYIHVPMNKVHTRSISSDSRHKKKAVSSFEVDFSGAFILNRTELLEINGASQKAANMGIESIWEDERRRRLQNSQELPELKTQEDEARVCDPTSSEVFFLRALKERYLLIDSKKSEELSTTTLDESTSTIKKKFDLKNYLEATTYGAECSQSSGSSNQQDEMDVTFSLDISQTVEELESHFLNTQSTLASTSKKVNEIISTAENEDDFDSLLAPFSQAQHSGKTTQSDINEQLDENQIRHLFEEFDAEDESEFNMTLADLEIAMFEDENVDAIPQLDGVDDEIDSKMIPGPSKKFIKSEPTSFCENSNDLQDNLSALMSHFNQEASVKKEVEEIVSSSDSESDDEGMKSFYDQTLLANDFDDADLNSPENPSNELTELPIKLEPVNDNKPCVITLANDPPDPSLVLDRLQEFDIPSTVNKHAFYSNPLDVTDKKEVGFNILEIHSDKLNDCDDFKSTIFPSSQLKHFQAQKLSHHLGFMPKSIAHTTDLIDNNLDVIIHPIKEPPTYNDAKKWLQTGIEETESQNICVLEDSPVKVKRAKIFNVFEGDGDSQDTQVVDLDTTLIPRSPEVGNDPPVIPSSLEKDLSSPQLSEFIEDGIYLSYSARKKRRRRAKKTFSERFQEIMKAKVGSTSGIERTQNFSESSQSSMDNEKMSDSSEDLHKDTQSNSSNTKLSDDTFICSIIPDANIPLNDSFDGTTMSETYGFKMKLESLQSTDEHNDLTILSMELHVQTKDDFNPNPETDEIVAIFWCVEGYYVNEQATSSSGIILICDTPTENLGYFKEQIEITRVKNELELLEEFFKKIRIYDPDIFAGYEIELLSWGYLFERGFVLNMNLCNALSRMPLDKEPKTKIIHEDEEQGDQGDYNTEQKIPGRILLDVWRLMRHEIALTSYSFENIAYHILHRR